MRMQTGWIRRSIIVLLTIAAFAGQGGVARADEPAPSDPAARAAALKKKGDAAMDALRYEDAIAAYTEAYGASADPALLYNRGRVYQARSEYPQALADMERFAHDASPELRARVPRLSELIVELRGRVTTLSVTCNVEGARVLVRDRPIGLTPLGAPVKLNAGAGVIEVEKDGYVPFRQEMNLPGGGELATNVVLVAREKGGVLAVRTTGAGTVFVDGKPVGAAPVETTVDAGTHAVLVRGDQYEDTQTSVVVVAGERKEVTVTLEKRPSILTRWWFWTAAGAVVAGGVAVSIVLLSDKPAPSGDRFSPSQVRGPLTVSTW